MLEEYFCAPAEQFPAAEARMREHLRHCESCVTRLRMMHAAGMNLEAISTEASNGEHPDHLAIASFATHGLDALSAKAVVAHLSSCRDCRLQLAFICAALDQRGTAPDTAPGGSSSDAHEE